MAAVLSLETLVFYIVIRPRSYSHSWLRALAAFLIAIAILLFFGVALIHAPPFMFWHWLWLAGITVVLVILLITSIIQTLKALVG